MKKRLSFQKLKVFGSRAVLLLAFLSVGQFAFSQKADSIQKVITFRGSITATNNGFSFVPTFSLGKPALMTAFSVSDGRRLSFEPNFWYSMLDFKPWSFVFIWRYKLIKREKFQFTLGSHLPAINFRSATVIENGIEKEVIKARRFYPAVELLPVFHIKKDISLSLYCLFGKGIEKEVSTNNFFVSLRPDFNHIPLARGYFLRLNPQFYYLRIAANDGIYAAAGLALARRNFPFSISAMMNKAIKSDILAKDFDWNVNLIYAFDQKLVRQ